jgi:hypothetical protein
MIWSGWHIPDATRRTTEPKIVRALRHPCSNRWSMSELLPPLEVRAKTGAEAFHHAGTPLGFDLLSFWRWSASDLASNALRGRLAEYVVAQAFGIADNVRAEWDAFDLRTPSGVTLEVKSAAYLQTWAQKAPSTISFDIRPTRAWDPLSNEFATEVRRQAEIYVFALLSHRDKATLDPLNLEQWTFFVLRTAVLDAQLPVQRRLALSALLKLSPEHCGFENLRSAIERAAFLSATRNQ